jgi:alpha,alpha-trehalose phosphorylase
MAARLGMADKAFDYLGNSLHLDLQDQCNNTRDGIHTSNMAGTYMAIVYGFGGLRLKEQGISFSPLLPSEWEGYRFIMMYDGSRISVEVKPRACSFTLEKGNPQRIKVYEKEYLLEETLVIERCTGPPRIKMDRI